MSISCISGVPKEVSRPSALLKKNTKSQIDPKGPTYIGVIKGLYRIMEKKMETLGPLKWIHRVIEGLCRDNGKENGNY